MVLPEVTATVADRIHIAGLAYSVAAGDGSVWVATSENDRGRGAVVHIDPAGDRVVATVRIDGFAYNLAVGDGAAWVPVYVQGKGNRLLRIDAGTNEVTGRVVGVTGPVVVDATGVWAIQGEPSERDWAVVQIDPSTLAIGRRVPVSDAPFDMAAGTGSIWALVTHRCLGGNRCFGPLLHIDASTGVAASVDFSNAGILIAADDAGVWLSAWDPSRPNQAVAAFVSASTNALSGRPVGISNFRPFAVADGRAWFIAGPGTPGPGICGLNVLTREVDACVRLRSIADLEGAHDPAAFEPNTDSIWIGEYEAPLVTRIDVTVGS
ncbi:MAG: hypothetical protein M3Q23_09945 [Actinomycetota bacterium]|nr:hypothetical protein [Actinomycetota bacterium]